MRAKARTSTPVAALLCPFCALLLTGTLRAEEPYNVAWQRQLGSSDEDQGRRVAVESSSGTAFIGGWTLGNIDGPNIGVVDAFLARYSATGNLDWKYQLGTQFRDEGYGVATDEPRDAVYITGLTRGNIGGTNAGSFDAFLTKFTAGAGSLQWSQQIGTTEIDESHGVAVDSAGNVFISGLTLGNLNGANAGGVDAFVAKFDTDGAPLWTRQLGTAADDQGNDVAVDSAGNAYITGWTKGNIDGANAGDNDGFLSKYSAAGNLQWSRQIGTFANDQSFGVAVDGSGNIYITGSTNGNINGANSGGSDAFLAKYDGAGDLLWKRQIGTPVNDQTNSVAVDPSGNVYISGWTGGSIDFLTPGAGGDDVFMAKYDGAGNLFWTRQIGTTADDQPYGAAVDGLGNVFISGGYTLGNLGGTNLGDRDDSSMSPSQAA